MQGVVGGGGGVEDMWIVDGAAGLLIERQARREEAHNDAVGRNRRISTASLMVPRLALTA